MTYNMNNRIVSGQQPAPTPRDYIEGQNVLFNGFPSAGLPDGFNDQNIYRAPQDLRDMYGIDFNPSIPFVPSTAGVPGVNFAVSHTMNPALSYWPVPNQPEPSYMQYSQPQSLWDAVLPYIQRLY